MMKEKRALKIKKKRAKCIGHIWRWNCLLEHVIEGDIKMTRRQGRRRK
jgi:hypothetical protein